MKDNVVSITTAKRRVYVGDDASLRTFSNEIRGEWAQAFTRIGNHLGLSGHFLIHFGYLQIEEAARIAGLILDVTGPGGCMTIETSPGFSDDEPRALPPYSWVLLFGAWLWILIGVTVYQAC